MAGDGLYLAAAQVLSKVSEGKGAIRTLCYASSIQNKKALYGLVMETARHLNLIKRILEQSGWLELANKSRKALPRNVKRVDTFLAAVLLQDFLFTGGGALKCGPELKGLVEASKARLRSELVRAQMHFKRQGLAEGICADAEETQVPRYVRINRCLVSEGEATDVLVRELEAFTKLTFPTNFNWDPHVNHLLVFPPGTDLTNSPAYRNNQIILQDKASCFPPQVLMPPWRAHVIDACAAPGNKTSQLCALVGPDGHVFAFERDQKRFETLKKLTNQALPQSETPVRLSCLHADFLSVDPFDPRYAQVEYVLCDPSCSGSGMPMSLERSLSTSNSKESKETEKSRLEQLSKFQCTILKHAAKFPALKKLVYSTCSIHAMENEFVVSQVLKSCPHLQLAENVLPTWHRRGLDTFDFGKLVIRASPKEDQMNGFFVALFERKIE